MATKESSELFQEVPLFELKEHYNKTPEGKKFLKEAIIDRRSTAGVLLALDQCLDYCVVTACPRSVLI